jgi:hypothetical protein
MKSSIFGVWGLPQQAKTESSASGRNLFVLSLSDQEGIACQRRVHIIKTLDRCVL